MNKKQECTLDRPIYCGGAMILVWLYFFLGLTTLVASSANSVFTNSFLVRFHRSVKNDVVHDIAARNGFENVGEVCKKSSMINWFLLKSLSFIYYFKSANNNRKYV